MKVPENFFVFKLDRIVFEGVDGQIGPLSFEVARRDDWAVYLDDSRDGEMLARIIKGIAAPLEGRVIKSSGDATGWVVPDGIIALMGEDFFSKTVRDEIAFSVRVGEAKGTLEMGPFVSKVLRRSEFASRLKEDISSLSKFERHLLVLASALCMLPECLILVDPFQGVGKDEAPRYLNLLRYGRKMVGFATLQIVSVGGTPVPFETLREVRMRSKEGEQP